MLPTGHGQAALIKVAGQRLTGGVFVQPGHRRLDVAGQKSTFDQPLGVDNQIIFFGAQGLLEALPLAALEGFPDVFAPAADRHRNHFAHGRVPGRDFSKAFFHHPVKGDARNGPGRIGQRRQGMNHIPKG